MAKNDPTFDPQRADDHLGEFDQIILDAGGVLIYDKDDPSRYIQSEAAVGLDAMR